MKSVIGSERRPIKLWLDVNELIDEKNPGKDALSQAKNLANLPFLFKHVAIMPDSHLGYGMPIGGVIATDKVVIPNAVGVDIGCGMSVVKFPVTVSEIAPYIKDIMGKIRQEVPVGFNSNKEPQNSRWMPYDFDTDSMRIVSGQLAKAYLQVGTLGGGNHFIEIQADEEDNVYLMVHSGSRNLGFTVAKFYNGIAKELNEKWHTVVPIKHDLAFLPVGNKWTEDYIREMKYCTEFAKGNRALMMAKVTAIIANVFSEKNFKSMDSGFVNIAHNYAVLENHFGKNVWVHRKGATSAKEGELGIIPGSQGASSYIVRGLGNKESFMSCSHGAGRKMGRKQAKRELNLEDEQRKLEELGIVHSVRNVGDLDEAPGAYKDIEEVMENQLDLVEVVTKLKPLAVVKG